MKKVKIRLSFTLLLTFVCVIESNGKGTYAIEKYIWKSKSSKHDTTNNGLYKLVLIIYSDSSYTLSPKEYRYGQERKVWINKNKRYLYGKWIIKNSKRIFLYEGKVFNSIRQELNYIYYENLKMIRKSLLFS